MRYRRGIKKFLLPSIILHLFVLSLSMFLFKTEHNTHRSDAYEVGLINLHSNKKTIKQSPNKDTKSIKTGKIDNLQTTERFTPVKPDNIIKRDTDVSTYMIEDIPGHSTKRENAGLSGPSDSTAASGFTGSANTDDQHAYPDYSLNPKPGYPLMARRRGYEGTVLIKVKVLKSGKVGALDVERSSQYEILDNTALNAVSEWTFVPAKRNGASITSWVTVPVKFELKDG